MDKCFDRMLMLSFTVVLSTAVLQLRGFTDFLNVYFWKPWGYEAENTTQ